MDRLDPTKTVEQVLAVNRFSNKIYLKGVRAVFVLLGNRLIKQTQDQAGATTVQPKSKKLHYSRCQLYLGKEKFMQDDGSLEEKE